MSASERELTGPMFGDDGFSPGPRGWMATPLAVMLWSAIFTVVFFSTRDVSLESVGASFGYIQKLFIAFVLAIFFVIPTTTLILGHIVDDVLGSMHAFGRAVLLIVTGSALGAIPAAFIYYVNTSYGWQPFTQFIIPSALTGVLTWVLVEPCLRHRSLRTGFVAMTVLVVIGSLSIGVLVMTGRF